MGRDVNSICQELMDAVSNTDDGSYLSSSVIDTLFSIINNMASMNDIFSGVQSSLLSMIACLGVPVYFKNNCFEIHFSSDKSRIAYECAVANIEKLNKRCDSWKSPLYRVFLDDVEYSSGMAKKIKENLG